MDCAAIIGFPSDCTTRLEVPAWIKKITQLIIYKCDVIFEFKRATPFLPHKERFLSELAKPGALTLKMSLRILCHFVREFQPRSFSSAAHAIDRAAQRRGRAGVRLGRAG